MIQVEVKAISSFQANIRSAIRRLWSGNGDLYDFFEDMDRVIRLGYEDAWREGALSCGIKPDERTVEETQRLEALIVENRQYVFPFGEAILENSKMNGGKLSNVMPRSELWVNRYNQVKNIAQSMACENQKLKWIWSPQKEHCTDCRKLNGRVYRASIWAKYNLYPQSQDLACHGYRCGCQFMTTDEKVTPGKPPGLSGSKSINPTGYKVIDLGNGYARLEVYQ